MIKQRNNALSHLFCRLPTTLLYPEVTRSGVDAYLETIERKYITPLDLQTWQQLQLFLLEPEWLQSSTRRKLRTRFYQHLQENEGFIHNIIQQYGHIELFSQNIDKQDSLFFTVCALPISLRRCRASSMQSYNIKMVSYKYSKTTQRLDRIHQRC